MNRGAKFITLLSCWVVAIFTIAMFLTFFSEYLQSSGFFGDKPFVPYTSEYGFQKTKLGGVMDNAYYWGARHYWYFWMCVILFILSIVRVVLWSVDYLDKK